MLMQFPEAEIKMAKILIVDDSNTMRRILRSMLEDDGHEIVGEATNGELAHNMYSVLKPDLVTMDINMKDADGIESLKEIIHLDSEAKVLMISAISSAPKKEEILGLGAVGYITKPFQIGHLHEQVNLALEH